MDFLINGIRGFCMALADCVPGVSGGTIAFILGFYDKFIGSLDKLVYGKLEEKKKALAFLIKIGIGWGVGAILTVLLLTSLFQNHIYKVSSMFLGLIIFSIPLVIKQEKEVLKGKYINILFTLIGIVVVSLITYFNPMSGTESAIDITNLNVGLVAYIFVTAMVAISAMVLPGVSGSTLLLIFGLYMPIMGAIKGFLHLEFKYIPVLIVFGLGVLTGIVSIIKLIKLALEKARSQTIYCIIGLMIGSIYAIAMGPTTLDVPQPAMGLSTFSIIFFVIGCGIIVGLEKIKDILEKKIEEKK